MSLLQAIQLQDINAIRLALRTRSSLAELDPQGNTVLHAAVSTGNPAIVELILGQSPGWEKNPGKQTPLELAQSLSNRYHSERRIKIAKMVGRYFDAKNHQILSPITVPADGCSRQYLRQRTEVAKEHGGARIHAALVHHSRKTQGEKSRFVLADVHAELRQVLARMEPPTVGNIAVASMTFELKTGSNTDNNEKRIYVTIPIKVSGKPVFTISDTLTLDEENDLETVLHDLKTMYTAGKAAHGDHKHYQPPHYDNRAGDAQLINHSEQPLYFYLKSEDGASTLVNRLIAKLRGDDLIPFDTEIKVSNIAVHLHSTKAPCGPCETVIAGAQCLGTISTALEKAFVGRSYVEANKNTEEDSLPFLSEPYRFVFPKKKLQLITTFSADNSGAHAPPRYTILDWKEYDGMSEIELNSAIKSNQKHVHVVKFMDKPPAHDGGELSEHTVFSSASDVNKNVAKRKVEYDEVNDDSLDGLKESLAYMKDTEKKESAKHSSSSATGSPSYLLKPAVGAKINAPSLDANRTPVKPASKQLIV